MESRTELGPGIRRHCPKEEQAAGDSCLSRSALSHAIVSAAHDLGFIRAGVASLEPFVRESVDLKRFVERGYSGCMDYLSRSSPNGALERLSPAGLMPGAKSALCVALPYRAPPNSRLQRSDEAIVGESIARLPADGTRSAAPKETIPGTIASYALGYDYHLVLKEKLLLLADQIANLVGAPVVARACVDSAPLFERDLAARAGILFIGKNTLGIAPGAGSHFVLGELLLDLELETTSPPIDEGCGSCQACLDACPTDAFIEPYLLDATRCISYLTIESRDDIPSHLRSAIGDRIFGCDACQSSCPYNQSGHKRAPSPELGSLERLNSPDLVDLLRLGSSAYRRLVTKTSLRRIPRDLLARNAAVALGNSGQGDAVSPLLEAALQHRSQQVRAHSVWALEELANEHHLQEAQEALAKLQLAQASEE